MVALAASVPTAATQQILEVDFDVGREVAGGEEYSFSDIGGGRHSASICRNICFKWIGNRQTGEQFDAERCNTRYWKAGRRGHLSKVRI